MKGIYNPLKLYQHLCFFGSRAVAVFGIGAVGSYVSEYLTKLGIGTLLLIDLDKYELENLAKTSCIIGPENVGENKAVAAARRLQSIAVDGATVIGIDANITDFGPQLFDRYDVVVLALDNYAAKLYFNQIWLQIEPDRRPLLAIAGTYEETAQVSLIDGKSDMCYRCLISEDWLENSTARTSCTGVQTREIEGKPEIVRTSNRASAKAALMTVDAVEGYLRGDKNLAPRRFSYTPNYDPAYSSSVPIKNCRCVDCQRDYVPKETQLLYGNELSLTLRDLFEQVTKHLGIEEYEILTHQLNWAGVSYGGFITEEYCHACGKKITPMLHEGRAYPEMLRCDECKEKDAPPKQNLDCPVGKVIRSFVPNQCDALLDRSLFSLGYPLGSIITVVVNNNRFDFLEDDLDGHVDCVDFVCFSFKEALQSMAE